MTSPPLVPSFVGEVSFGGERLSGADATRLLPNNISSTADVRFTVRYRLPLLLREPALPADVCEPGDPLDPRDPTEADGIFFF